MWSRGEGSIDEARLEQTTYHSTPTNLALIGHKITLYRFNQGAHTIAGGGLKSEQGGGLSSPCLLTLTTEFLSQLYVTLWTELLAKNNYNFWPIVSLTLDLSKSYPLTRSALFHYCMQAGCVRRCWAVHQPPRYPSVTVWRPVMMMVSSTVSTAVDQWWVGTRRHSSVPQGTPRCLTSLMRTLTARFNSSSQWFSWRHSQQTHVDRCACSTSQS